MRFVRALDRTGWVQYGGVVLIGFKRDLSAHLAQYGGLVLNL